MEFPNTVINSPAGQAGIKHKLRGVNSTISAGLVSGLYAIHYAAEFLRFRRATALLAGGVEELAEESYLSFQKAGWTSVAGELRPFAPDRDGTVVGRIGALDAGDRGARAPQGRHAPAGSLRIRLGARRAQPRTYNPRAEGAESAIRLALESAGIQPVDIGAVVASANGGRASDAMEARALRAVFGGRLPKFRSAHRRRPSAKRLELRAHSWQ